MSFWQKFDKVLSKAEKTGFKAANKAHYYAVNIILASCAYGIYTIFRDYNNFFKDARVIKKNKNIILFTKRKCIYIFKKNKFFIFI